MTEKARLKDLIDNAKKPNVSEWVYEVESFLENEKIIDEEALMLIDGIKKQGDTFHRCENLVALLRIPLIIAPKPSTSSPLTKISRKSAIQTHCLHAK